MREINVNIISKAVETAFIEANIHLPVSLQKRIEECSVIETGPLASRVFDDMKQNMAAAADLEIPVCQDCGMAVVFAEIGQEVHITGGNFEEAVNKGVADGYTKGYLRKSVVCDPLRRVNSGNNTPAVIHTRIVPGDKIKITAAPKGFGSENMSTVKMFNPTVDIEDIIGFVTDTVIKAGAKPCPPIVLGIGIGGDFEHAAYLSKKALCRDVDKRNPDPFYAELEQRILDRVNDTNIGPQGYSGKITALACNIEYFGTHIAGLPVAVNIGCHVTRHKTVVL